MAKGKLITEKELAEAIKLSRESAIREERERLGLIPPSGKLVEKTKTCQVYGRNVFFPEYFSDSFWVSVLDVSEHLPNDRRSRRKWWGKIYQDEVITSEQAEKEGIWYKGKHFTEEEWIKDLKRVHGEWTIHDKTLKRGGGIREKIFLPRTFLEQLPREIWTEDGQGKKQGASVQFNYSTSAKIPEKGLFRPVGKKPEYYTDVIGLPDLPKPKKVGDGIVQYVSRVQNYANGTLNGPTVYFDCNYQETGFEYYKDGKQHGLARHKNGEGEWEYSYWEKGEKIMDDAETRAFLKERVEKLKMEKRADSAARSTTLRKVLKAGTKKQKLRILSKFHSSAPAKRHVSKALSEQFIKKPDRR